MHHRPSRNCAEERRGCRLHVRAQPVILVRSSRAQRIPLQVEPHMEHPFLVEEYIPAQVPRVPEASHEFSVPEPESAAALPPFPNLPPSEALLLTPTDPQYADYLPAANLRTELAPALRAVCKTENAVAVMTDWVRSNSLSFAVRCGGHSY